MDTLDTIKKGINQQPRKPYQTLPFAVDGKGNKHENKYEINTRKSKINRWITGAKSKIYWYINGAKD